MSKWIVGFALALTFAAAGEPALMAQGNIGPDAFGYVGADTSVGVPFNYEDISGTGTVIFATGTTLGAVAGPFPIGFTFNFYGLDFTTFFVDSEGYISFTALAVSNSVPATFPTAAGPSNLIAPFWTNLANIPAGSGPLVFQTLGAAPSRRLIVQWHNWDHQPDVNPVNRFQIKLFEGTNIIEFHYNNAINKVGGALNSGIGIENSTGTVGLQYRFTTSTTIATTPTALTGTAVRFTPPQTAAGVVNDGTGTDIDEQLTGAEISANWTGFAGAGGAAIRTFEVAIGRTAGGTEIRGFTDVGNVLTATFGGLTLAAGDLIFVTVRGTDVNGVVTAAVSSDGLRIVGVHQNSSGGHGGPCSAGQPTRGGVSAVLALSVLLALCRRLAGR